MIRSAPARAVLGVTLLELMMTLTVAAILLVIAIPSFQHVMGSTNQAAVINDLRGDIAYARNESASRRTNVTVASSSGGWEAGWSVSASTSGPVPPTTLRVHGAVSQTYTLAASNTKLQYQSDGTLKSPATDICFALKAPADTRNSTQYLVVQVSGIVQQSSDTSPSANCPSP